MRHRLNIWCLFLLLTVANLLSAQVIPDSTEHLRDTTAKQKDYMQAGYYDSIMVSKPFEGTIPQSFGEVFPKYQSADFQYEESLKDQIGFFNRVIGRFWKFIESLFPSGPLFSEDLFYHILSVIGLIFFAYLLYRFYISSDHFYTRIKREEQDITDTVNFVERNLMEVDVRKYIDEALRQHNFPLAIRYQQLLNIQILNRKKLIDWNYTKTNVELMEDVSDTELKKAFLVCSSNFDRVWFGDQTLSQVDYEQIIQQFEQFQKRWS